jgi:transporter family protein
LTSSAIGGLVDVQSRKGGIIGGLASSWQFWAVLAAVFAALTAIFAKIGVSDVNSNYATFLRTIVVVLALGALIWMTGEAQPIASLSGRTVIFLILSGLATGASWLCYFRALKIGQAAQVAPVDKLSVVFVAVLGALFLGETLTATGWAGVTLIAIGAVLVALP